MNEINNELISQEKKTYNQKKTSKEILKDAIRTLIGTEVSSISFFALFNSMNLNIYLISYLREKQSDNKKLKLEHSYFFAPVLMITFLTMNLFLNPIEKKLGIKISLIVGTTIIILSCLLLYFSEKYLLSLLSFGFIAIGCFYIPLLIRNNISYFYEIRGKLIGILSVPEAFVNGGFNIIAEKFIINPESDEADVDANFYTYNVSRKYLNFILLCMILVFSSNLIASLLIIPFDKKKHGKGLFKKEKKFIRKSTKSNGGENLLSSQKGKEKINEEEVKEEEEEEEIEENNVGEGEEEKLKNSNKELKKKKKNNYMKIAIKSKRVKIFFIMGMLMTPWRNFVNSAWRNIALRNDIPTSYQQNIQTFNPFVTCFTTLIFGCLSDSIPFRFLYSCICFFLSFIAVFFCFTFTSPFLFTIVLLFNTMANAALQTLAFPHYMKVFGLKHYIEINAIISFSNIVMTPICSIFMFIFDNNFAEDNHSSSKDIKLFDSGNKPYFILFTICASLNALTGVLSCFESEEKFKIEEIKES